MKIRQQFSPCETRWTFPLAMPTYFPIKICTLTTNHTQCFFAVKKTISPLLTRARAHPTGILLFLLSQVSHIVT